MFQGSGVKESKRDKEFFCSSTVNHLPGASGKYKDWFNFFSCSLNYLIYMLGEEPSTPHKKKGFFKSFWKKSKHYSLEQ